jgi:hypothetical protein
VFETCHLELDSLPSASQFDRIVLAVGDASQEANKVEVPFERVAPEPAAWWKQDVTQLLHAPIGRLGAQGVQYFELGRGTEQHALVAGTTGSGKSTLLHVLILSLAVTYSPDDIQLYLVDFKKGIEFKDYATYQLPHAQVVAIQSEREFGLSVLEGLDRELQRRGDIFRDLGVTSLTEYRQKHPEDKLPRMLLLVDEFQEFFTEDDSIASQVSLILDRLVRQGRAFGMHVLLASQSLTGAYSMSRSTMDQMAVRIALQCKEGDSRIILGDDNPAARLLSRPGEAIGETLPHDVRIGRGRDLHKILLELAEIISERALLEDESIDETIYLVIVGIQRARDLRSVDIYTPAEASEQLTTILRDGPDLGVHTLISCDTYANLERVLQRENIAEFELRVALPMSETDSNYFIDSPAANKLDTP